MMPGVLTTKLVKNEIYVCEKFEKDVKEKVYLFLSVVKSTNWLKESL